MTTPRILLTNDDGVRSPGLLAAAEALHPLGAVDVFAPLRQQTAMGRAQTGNRDATLQQVELAVAGQPLLAWACDASPAATVGHGLKVMPGYAPALLVSGINYGENLGASITSSGTVGAALEGACRGIPALAVSMETGIESHHAYTEQDWSAARHFLALFAGMVLERGLPGDVHVLKIDVPAGATPETPWRLTRLSPDMYYESRLATPSLASRLGDATVTKGAAPGESPETDVYAVSVDRVVSVTPLTLDFTARTAFGDIRSWLAPGAR